VLTLTGCASDGDAAAAAGGGGALAAVSVPELLGRAGSEITGWLGPPDFRRADGAAELLQYRSSSCVLDLYLYRSGGLDDYRVKHIEARDRAQAPLSPQSCLSTITPRRATAG
jgi:hypothetical protein